MTLSRSSRRPRDVETARARRQDRHVGAGLDQLELPSDDRRFGVAAQPGQAFVVAVQAPHVARMLAGSAQRGIEAEVGGVHRGGVLDVALLEQQRAVGVPGRLHPAPRFVVGQRVVEFDRPPQLGEGLVESPSR